MNYSKPSILDLFDKNFTKTGSVNWFKAMTLRVLNKLESELSKWQKQTFDAPVSPKLVELIQSLSRSNDNRLIYKTEFGQIDCKQFPLQDL